MKKTLKVTAAGIMLSMMMAGTANAASRQDFYNKSALESACGTINQDGSITFRTNETELTHSKPIHDYFLTVSPLVFSLDTTYVKNQDGSFTFPTASLDELTVKASYVENEASRLVRTVVPDGMDEKMALQMIARYVKDNYRYDYDGLYTDAVLKEQSAYYTMNTKLGVCASLSKIFKAMADSLTYNNAGHVSYGEGQRHNTVICEKGTATIKGYEHMWAKVIYLDGTWAVYDVTNTFLPENADKFYKANGIIR